MSQKGRFMVLSNGLTPKQTSFVKNVLQNIKDKGAPLMTEAALNSYDTKDKDVAAGIAKENMGKPAVQEAVQIALEGAGLTLDVLSQEISGIARTKVTEISGDVKLRAITESLKLLGAYPNNKQPVSGHSTVINVQNISFTDAKMKLKELHEESSEFFQDE